MTPIFIAGVKWYEDCTLVIDGEPYQVRRSWFKRLFWKPRTKYRTVVPKEPDPNFYLAPREPGGTQTGVAHPATLKHLKLFGEADTEDNPVKSDPATARDIAKRFKPLV